MNWVLKSLKNIISRNWWSYDPYRKVTINSSIIKNYFNKTHSLVFDQQSASKEEEVLKEYFNNKVKILDLGCGNGRLAKRFNKSIKYYLGVDFSQGMINDAKGLNLDNCEIFKIEGLNY